MAPCATEPWWQKTALGYIKFEVLTAVVMKMSVFWDITPCSPLKVKPRFGELFGFVFRVEV
jgi:hypothetical protein